MPLEATMIIVDNSEYMRNGDFTPSRFSAQSDAVSVIFGTKTQSNPENTVGVMTMAGKTPEVLVTPTQDIGKILTALHTLKISGDADISTGIQIAQLALKHRQNKNQRQRIIVFVGSPLATDEKSLVKLGKKLKKNNVSIDVISFGEGEENDTPLRAFVDSVSSGDNSHLVSIPPGPHLLSDMVINSPVLAGDMGGGEVGDMPGGTAGPSNDFEFGVDPTLDPELAMALRLSMQEEEARRGATEPSGGETSGDVAASGAGASGAVSAAAAAAAAPEAEMDEDDDEEAQLAAALALSQGDDVIMEDEEEDEIQAAIRLSEQDQAEDPPKK